MCIRDSQQAVNKAGQLGKDVEVIKKTKTQGNKKGPTGSQIHKHLEEEEYKVETVTVEFRIALQQARTAKKMTQEQVAKAIFEKQSVIQEYESGKAIPDNKVISKLEKILGCKLPRQKKKKAKKSEEI
eukprot:TRINITY_DN495_c0_g1_i8.p1 TRINITY_DN495_c0_g1~~TRINITY_DN495_c0_g1_i8.p1  ORF type:complete len:128 (-),score=32.50 TRINITY_DN495_c0_g1_i8:81-464(-)